MKLNRWPLYLYLIATLVLAGCDALPTVSLTPAPPQPTPLPADDTPLPADDTPPPVEDAPPAEDTPDQPPGDPFALVSQERMFAYMTDLTAIQPYSGWRNSATEGEAEAIEYVAQMVAGFDHLQTLGLDIERQSFRVFLATELWETRLHLTVGGREIEVDADGQRGPRDDVARALRFDSDGALNDADRDPVVVEGPVVLVDSTAAVDRLSAADAAGRVVFVDYGVLDRTQVGRTGAARVATDLLAKEPAGIVMITQFSNQPYESHGTFVGDLSAFAYVESGPNVPTLYARLEDLAPAGIETWDDLARVEAARLTWDADVFSPGTSGNLVAHIPGADPTAAVILGAHIDSPNGPGAMDDGSGSVVLLEVAQVLNEARAQPPTDLVLVWFGSEEIGLYGSYHFVSTHQELLDRTLAMLQTDCLCRPLDGIDGYLNLVTWSYGRLGDDRLTWPTYLGGEVDERGIFTYPSNYYGVESDNSAFTGFDVPSANLIYMDHPAMEQIGGVHYGGHIHDPYDTVELAREVGDVLEEMALTALTAALETGPDGPQLRVAPRPDGRAVFVASHTEPVHMSPTTFTDLGMALAWEGLDVDLVPYGQPVTAADLDGADLVVALPVADYPSPDGDPAVYDEAWTEEEVAVLEAYVAQGGLLVMTNSGHRLKYHNIVEDPNEDWPDANVLAGRFGVTFREGSLSGRVRVTGSSPLTGGVTHLDLAGGNGVPFDVAGGEVLAQAGSEPVVALVDHGQGQVLVLADVGLLGAGHEPANLDFWLNLARYDAE